MTNPTDTPRGTEPQGRPIQIESVVTPWLTLLMSVARVDAYGRQVQPGAVSLQIGRDGHRPRAIYVRLDELESAVALLAGEMRGVDGAALIAAERRRHVEEEGWRCEHDDLHQDDALALAAVC